MHRVGFRGRITGGSHRITGKRQMPPRRLSVQRLSVHLGTDTPSPGSGRRCSIEPRNMRPNLEPRWRRDTAGRQKKSWFLQNEAFYLHVSAYIFFPAQLRRRCHLWVCRVHILSTPYKTGSTTCAAVLGDQGRNPSQRPELDEYIPSVPARRGKNKTARASPVRSSPCLGKDKTSASALYSYPVSPLPQPRPCASWVQSRFIKDYPGQEDAKEKRDKELPGSRVLVRRVKKCRRDLVRDEPPSRADFPCESRVSKISPLRCPVRD